MNSQPHSSQPPVASTVKRKVGRTMSESSESSSDLTPPAILDRQRSMFTVTKVDEDVAFSPLTTKCSSDVVFVDKYLFKFFTPLHTKPYPHNEPAGSSSRTEDGFSYDLDGKFAYHTYSEATKSSYYPMIDIKKWTEGLGMHK